ncbi:TPA: DUF2787 domain-containing protein [Vibrio alginolyticus]|uniref:DUF2787 domain-containing protein n=1 Tax=Vibrio alginolyticus TaxID=663 RepID=UPI002277CEE6|nr:DUF2787 domain-containing protein [Vibrio alginolyticus]WAE55424.1 DUF2787 domain-containing protein [Vibrio alginolyticus]
MDKNNIEEQVLQFQACPLPISSEFHHAISQRMQKADLLASRSLTLNFRDTSYSSEAGGFHPVEIAVHKGSKDKWCISYITDFAYFGLGYPELERAIDFDIANNMAFATGIGWRSIGSSGFIELYRTWESNFLAYLSIDAFDEINVSVN